MSPRPPYSPDVGERFFAYSGPQISGARYYVPMTITKVTPRQIVAVDPLGRVSRFWRDKWCELGAWQFARKISITIPEKGKLAGSLVKVCG